VGGQEEQPCDWKSSIMVRGSSSRPKAVRAGWLLFSSDAITIRGEAILCEKKFLRVSILFGPQSLCVTKVVLHA